jgi:hypothetical protein
LTVTATVTATTTAIAATVTTTAIAATVTTTAIAATVTVAATACESGGATDAECFEEFSTVKDTAVIFVYSILCNSIWVAVTLSHTSVVDYLPI